MTMHVVRLGEVCEINPRMPKSLPDDRPVSFLPMAAVSEDGQIDFEEQRELHEVKKGYTYFERGDVLVAKITPCFENGKATRTRTLSESIGFGSTEFHVLRASEEVDASYLFHLIWNSKFREIGANNMTGSAGQRRVPADFLKRLEIPLPLLDEQRRIAVILDKADALRRKRKRAIEVLDELTQSIFREMFGDYRRSMSVPKVSVREAGRVQLGRQRAPKYQTGEFTKPYVRVANVYEDMIDTSDVLSMDFNHVEFPEYRLEYGDILLNEGQSTELVGRPAMWRCEIDECCFQNTLIRFQADRSKVLPEFALAVFLDYFRSGEFSKISSKTSSVAHLGAARFAAMPFPLLPLERQREFVRRKNAVDRRRKQMSESAILSEALFSSLQHRAFTGQL